MPFQSPPKICPVCIQESEFKFIRDYQFEGDNFSLYECLRCNVQIWFPFKSPEANWYEKQEKYRLKEPKIYRGYHKKILKLHHIFLENTRVLDLGCGTGEFINELQKRGCEVWGVDLDRIDIDIAKKLFGLKNLFAEPVENFLQRKDLPQFDIITFFEVIEHLDKPLEFIQNVKKILKPDGRIILSTPSRERMMVNLYEWDFPPYHLTRWNEEAISKLFSKINFKIFYIGYADEFGHLFELIAKKFSIGLVRKAEKISQNYEEYIPPKRKGNNFNISKRIFFKFLHLGAKFKNYSIAGIPAGFLWFIGKICKIKNGVMVVELVSEERN